MKNKTRASHKKAEKSVNHAVNFFKKLGFSVLPRKHICANGPDLVIIKKAECFRVEVKTVVYSTRQWKVKKNHRPQDDYIAIVFPNGLVHIDTMKDHVKKSHNNGDRSVTDLAKIYL